MGGQDKGLVEFVGQPLIAHILQTIAPQVAGVVISANRNKTRYAEFGYPVLADPLDDYQGPLAGMLAGLEAIHTPMMLVLPCDAPFINDDLVQRLLNGLTQAQADIAVAHDGKRLQPVHALLRTELLPSLKTYLAAGQRKIDLWYAQHNWVSIDFSDHPEQFHNLNKPEDRQKLNTPSIQ
jgi:molybdenum cofactor guanylyltransferase